MKTKHPFLKERQVKELFIVCRVDDYDTSTNHRGGFSPAQSEYLRKGGYLWPNQERAESAAKHVVQEQPAHTYGIFKLVSTVEIAVVKSPVRVQKV